MIELVVGIMINDLELFLIGMWLKKCEFRRHTSLGFYAPSYGVKHPTYSLSFQDGCGGSCDCTNLQIGEVLFTKH